ncbi:MAG: GntR family transcriptional regulator [Actinobacteria bacterium]|jgi:GntR family transcriptional regulator|nr:GntR family transcriptional regulator [Actinomycetota bacterium]
MLLSIDTASERPIYEQIADAVRRAVARGEILAGEKLPPASDVATGLDVNKHTVLRAYQELRDEGLVDLRRGRGAVVTRIATEIVGLHRDVEVLVSRAAALGIGRQALASLVSSTAPEPSPGPPHAKEPQS